MNLYTREGFKENNPNGTVNEMSYIKLAKYLSENIGEDASLRSSKFLKIIADRGVVLGDLSEAVFAPKIVLELSSFKHLGSRLAIQQRWQSLFLKQLRGDYTLSEITQKLNLGTPSTFHHWETGRRDLPLSYLLMAIDKLTGRLEAFIATLPFTISLDQFGFKGVSPKAYQEFFALPWTPLKAAQ